MTRAAAGIFGKGRGPGLRRDDKGTEVVGWGVGVECELCYTIKDCLHLLAD